MGGDIPQTDTRKSRLYERIGLRANSLKNLYIMEPPLKNNIFNHSSLKKSTSLHPPKTFYPNPPKNWTHEEKKYRIGATSYLSWETWCLHMRELYYKTILHFYMAIWHYFNVLTRRLDRLPSRSSGQKMEDSYSVLAHFRPFFVFSSNLSFFFFKSFKFLAYGCTKGLVKECLKCDDILEGNHI